MRSFFLLVPAALSMLAASPSLAQDTAPASSGGSMTWLWIVLLLIVLGGAAWYFGFARNRSTRTSAPGVDRDRIAGSAEQAKGSLKEGVGNVLGDAKLQAEGKLDKAEGKAQSTVGGIKDTLRGR
ncbi:CsbD family protein [Methylobacterium nodulans ORS 2060]|uniref:CsbD family protein n=2 Tax=Methylobacterium nodulans TaxID=114616 RepID=B8IHS6_METNO|nr:CsbD family protein [Methylobacterium nodulans ORS 2060]